jgi:REP-associated tyrosine transposase
LKANSSRWLRENGKWPGWQEGYGAFSVSSSNIDVVRRYIQSQEEHHRQQIYEEEFVSFLKRSGTSFREDEIFD